MMLLGEHAVLHNKRALVLAIDKRISVTLTPRSDKIISIHSELGKIQVTLDNLIHVKLDKAFQFVLAAIHRFQKQFETGFDLLIHSEFTDKIGLGSSAAVTVATLAVIFQYLEALGLNFPNRLQEEKANTLFETAKSVIQEVQGIGSGADVAASVYGGIIFYQKNAPCILKRIANLPPMVAVYSGFKTPTIEVIKKVEGYRKTQEKIYEKLFESMDACLDDAVMSAENKNWIRLGELMNIQQGLMNALSVGTPLLNKIVDTLNHQPGIFGAKISGSGLGDCIVGIGTQSSLLNWEASLVEKGVRDIPVKASLNGVCYG
jgi:mevalonate kinase